MQGGGEGGCYIGPNFDAVTCHCVAAAADECCAKDTQSQPHSQRFEVRGNTPKESDKSWLSVVAHRDM